MRLLLDTHVFLWWINGSSELTEKASQLIGDGKNELFLSAASCWEITIKAQLGKIDLPRKPDIFIPDQMSSNNIGSLPILASHTLQVFNLPPLHRDPFDRIIVAQSQLEAIPVITGDSLIHDYGVSTIWH